MRNGDVIARLLMGVTSLMWLGCQGGGSDIAGDTGTGNPGGTVTIAIIADTGAVPAPGLAKSPVPVYMPAFLPAIDSSGMPFSISLAQIHADRVCFILAPGQNCASLPQRFTHLSCDSDGIVVEGPFTFDLMTGTCTPSLDSVRIPEASYIGLKLYTREYGSGPENRAGAIGGTFVYEENNRNFRIELGRGMPAVARFTISAFGVSRHRHVRMTVALDPRKWLRGTDLEPCIRDGSLPLNSHGDLVISGPGGPGPCAGADIAVSRDVFSSGTVHVEF